MDNIVNSLHYFFRAAEDINYEQNKYILLVSIFIWAIVFFISYKKDIKQLNKTFMRIMGFTLISLQLGITIWLFIIRSNPFEDALPLYFCRMASITIGFSLMVYKIKCKVVNFFALFSIFGASIALLVPDMESYNFPHITTISYILIHSMLLFESMYVVRTSGVDLSRNSNIKITAGIIIPIHIINIFLKSNYAYTMQLPSILGVIPQEFSALFIVATTVSVVEIVQLFKNSGDGIRECVTEKFELNNRS